MKTKNKKINLTDLLNKQVYKKDIIYLLKVLSKEDLFESSDFEIVEED